MPILTLFSGISAKKQPFFWHNKVADIYVRRKHERKQNEHTTQGIRRSPPEKTPPLPQDGMAVGADTGACTGSGGHVSVPAEDSHCLCQNRNENKPPVRTGTQGKAVSETGTGCGSRRRFRSGDVPQHEPVLSTARTGQTARQLLAQDKVLGTQTAQEFLAEKLRPVTSPCRRIAGLYGATPLPGLLQRDVRYIAEGHAYASLCAAGGLGLELVFLKTTLRSLAGVTASLSARLAASCGIGAATALADGPFPFGDAVGVVLAAGGTAWCLIDLKQICAQLPWELTAALHQDILEFHEACGRTCL